MSPETAPPSLPLPAEESPLDPRQPLRRRRSRRIALTAVSAIAIVAGGVWIGRADIAQLVVDRELARRQIPARFNVADLGFNRQRLTDVVIGDPAHPDLVADWVEIDTALGFGTARVSGVRAGQVRLRGRLVDGRLALGAIDRLLPPSGTAPFALPDLYLSVADGRLRLEAPQGVIGVKLSGAGQLINGFRGRFAAIADHLVQGGCRAGRSVALMRLAIDGGVPTLTGPLRTASVACRGMTLGVSTVDGSITLGKALDRWRGDAAVSLTDLDHPAAALSSVGGHVDFDGGPAATKGEIELSGQGLRARVVSSATAAVRGRYEIGGTGPRFAGDVAVGRATLGQQQRAVIARVGRLAPGTPVAPLLARLAADLGQAVTAFDAQADLVFDPALAGGMVTARRVTMASASGVRIGLEGGQGLRYRLADGVIAVDGTASLGGGGLPDARMTLAQPVPGGAISGRASVAPYQAGGARLALGDIAFARARDGATRVTGSPLLSGPIADGAIVNARLPIDARWDGRTRVSINSACAPLTFDRLAIAGLSLARSRVTLCPTGGALVRIAGARIDGGGMITAPRIAGTLGGTTVALAADSARFRIGDPGFVLAGVKTRLGSGDRVTRIDAAHLLGHIDGAALGGSFDDGDGQIGGVPLLMSAAKGDWRFADGTLSVDGVMTLADADPTPRFKPLAGRDVALTLADNVITTTARLADPATGTVIGSTTIRHDLHTGRGTADLDVPGLTFDDRLQPDQLTPLTYGVIANVDGVVRGSGHIEWSADGATSTGVFRTTGMNLAAAFGPVTGITTEIRFTDLLSLQSAPDQMATVALINPGIQVGDGVIRYQTLAGQQLRVTSAHWPFAGGALDLEPALLDFGRDQPRNLTFRVTGMDARQFLQQFDFKNLDATGTFDGSLPMIFDSNGGRIAGGTLKIREGGGTIAYVGDLTQKDLGFWGNFAFQSLKSLKYRQLEVVMNGPLAGEMVTEVHFAGLSQGTGAKTNFLIRRLQKLPIQFNVTILAPFRGLIDSVQSFYDPRSLISRNLPQLIDNQRASSALPAPAQPIQPPESEKMP